MADAARTTRVRTIKVATAESIVVDGLARGLAQEAALRSAAAAVLDLPPKVDRLVVHE